MQEEKKMMESLAENSQKNLFEKLSQKEEEITLLKKQAELSEQMHGKDKDLKIRELKEVNENFKKLKIEMGKTKSELGEAKGY